MSVRFTRPSTVCPKADYKSFSEWLASDKYKSLAQESDRRTGINAGQFTASNRPSTKRW